jgi:gamma-glutamyltranspeptidase/glutathione hydrolase
MLKTTLLLVLLVLLLSWLSVLAADRPTPTPYRAGRSVVMAPHGMVAASQPLAAQVGLDVLEKGGNAVDAAVAVNAALGLVEPMMCGPGGDLYALVWDAKTRKLYGLNATGRSPYKATRKLFADRGLKEIPHDGPLSWSVPGCVDGWDELRRRFGTWSFAQLLEPSIRYAEEGFPVSEVISESWQSDASTLADHPDAAKTYLIDGRAPRPGDVFKNPFLAKTYRQIAKDGRDAFYKGKLAEAIVAFSDKNGGLFSLKDFADHTSTWVEPVSTTYRGHEVWEIPPPGQGIAVLEMLNLLEGYDLPKMGPEAPDYWHLFVEAKKLAYADRARFYADPAFSPAPVAGLISKSYAAERRKLINRGTLFALDEHHRNRLEPHRRPFHTIIPGLVTKDGKPWFVFGVMGGDMQPQGQLEVLCNLIDFGMNVQQAGEAPRLEHLGSATPTGRPGDADGGTVAAENGIPREVVEELLRRGHQVVRVPKNGGGYQGILIDPKTNMLHGGSDPRKDGCAVGY